MRHPGIAACLLVLATAPTWAQQLSPEADKAMWCGAAFAVLQQSESGEEASALGDKAGAAFAIAAAELIHGGMSVEDFGALAETYAAKVVAPFREGGYAQAECEALVAKPQE